MAKEFKDLTIKGDTYARHLQSEKGRGLLRWLATQPCKDEKFMEWTEKRNAWINEQLENYQDDVAVNEKMLPIKPAPEKAGTINDTSFFVIDKLNSIDDKIKHLTFLCEELVSLANVKSKPIWVDDKKDDDIEEKWDE
jgi:predicted metal-dependent hydrolase